MSHERLLVFGGTFDPPQRAHVRLPRAAAAVLRCTRILYVPTSANPLKPHPPASNEDRLAMLRLALAGAPECEISTLELANSGPSYTIDTLLALRAAHGPAVQLRLLMGSDSALSFPNWRNPRGILDLATPAVMLRPPQSRASFEAELRRLHPPLETDFWMRCVVDVPMVDASATEVRRRLAAHEPVGDLLDPAVEAYIRSKRLYGAATDALEAGTDAAPARGPVWPG